MSVFSTIRDSVRRFTLLAAGTDDDVLAQCSSSEKDKYSMLGSLVYIPVATSIVGILFAASYFTDRPFTVAGVCLGWGIVVFLIERAIIAHLRPGEHSFAVVARVVLAIALSSIVAELLTVYVFRPDIDEMIRKDRAAEMALVGAEGDGRIRELKQELADRKESLDLKERIYMDEIDGKNGTGIHGYGPSARAKEKAYEREKQEYESVKLRLEGELERTEQARDAAVAAAADGRRTGLLQSFDALYRMAGESTTILVVLVLLHVYFLLVELLPLIVKVNFKGSQYYDVQDAINEQQLAAVRETLDDRKKLSCLMSSFELESRRMAVENAAVKKRLDMAGERALIQMQRLVDTYTAHASLEESAKDKIPQKYVAEFLTEADAIFRKYIEASNAIITA